MNRTNRNRILAGIVVVTVLSICIPAARAERDKSVTPAKQAKAFLGAWRHVEHKQMLVRFEADTCTLAQGRRVLVGRILAWEGDGRVVIRIYGRKAAWELSRDGNTMKIVMLRGQQKSPPQEYRKLRKVPRKLKLAAEPLKLSKAKKVKPNRCKKIQDELARRLTEDQAVRTDSARRGDMAKIDADNTAYITGLVKKLGWIDASRFGPEASNAAFLIVQHSGNLSLMSAVLPEIEKDVKAKRTDSQGYALLYDRMKLMMGDKQRYGTQIGINAQGEPVVLTLEDREKVEEFRKEIGLFPLSRYLAHFEKNMGGKKVKFADDKE